MDAKLIISRLFPILLEAKLIIGRQLKMMDKLKLNASQKERTIPDDSFVIFFLIKRVTYETKPDLRL